MLPWLHSVVLSPRHLFQRRNKERERERKSNPSSIVFLWQRGSKSPLAAVAYTPVAERGRGCLSSLVLGGGFGWGGGVRLRNELHPRRWCNVFVYPQYTIGVISYYSLVIFLLFPCFPFLCELSLRS